MLSVYKSVKELFNDAREKNCPAILECITYYYMENLKSNMGSDTSYGKDKDLQMGKEKLPIIILQKKLLENCTCSQEELDEIDIPADDLMTCYFMDQIKETVLVLAREYLGDYLKEKCEF